MYLSLPAMMCDDMRVANQESSPTRRRESDRKLKEASKGFPRASAGDMALLTP